MVKSSSWQDYWQQPDGSIPEPMALLADMNVVAAETYTQLRSWLTEDRPDGFTRAQKELLFAVLDIFCEHAYGARFHTRNAVAEGISRTQVREALTMVILTRGINAFAEIGMQIWQECQATNDEAT